MKNNENIPCKSLIVGNSLKDWSIKGAKAKCNISKGVTETTLKPSAKLINSKL